MTTHEATRDRFAELRREHRTVPASVLLYWVRESLKVDVAMNEADWQYDYQSHRRGVLDVADFDGFSIEVYSDDEPYDWGDCEPTDHERESLEVIGVGVRLNGDDREFDAIWSVGYLDHDMRKAAIECAVYTGFIDSARAEIERKRDLAIMRGVN